MDEISLLMDQLVKDFISQCPECMVIGVSSDPERFDRVDNGSIVWHDLEREPSDPEWIKEIPMSRPQTLMIVEKFALDHSEREVRKVLSIIGEHFHNVTVFMALNAGESGRRYAALSPAFEWKRNVNAVRILKKGRLFFRLFGWLPSVRRKQKRIAVLTR